MTTDDSDKESGEQLIQNESDSHSQKLIISKTKNTAPTTVILGESILTVYDNGITKSIKHKKHVVVKDFPGAKIEDMKHVKPMHEKQPAQIIIHVGTNNLLGNKNSDDIAKETVGFANLAKTSKNM